MKLTEVHGYLKVGLKALPHQRTRRQYLVHRMVYAAHKGPIPEGMQINHINGDKSDNRVENLELATPRQNIHHAVATGLIPTGEEAWPARFPHRMARGKRHGSKTKPECVPRGDTHWTRVRPHLVANMRRGAGVNTSKLTDEQVLEIRKRRNYGEGLRTIAADYDVSLALISHICTRRIWKHLP